MKLSLLAEKLNARLRAHSDPDIVGLAALADADPSRLSFVTDQSYADRAARSRAGALLVPADLTLDIDTPLLLSDDIDTALESALLLFAPDEDDITPGIHPTAVVDPSADIAPDVAVGPQAVIGPRVTIGPATVIGPGCILTADVKIGSACRLLAQVVIRAASVIGDRVIIHPHVTIGADGFGYRFVDNRQRKIPHIGNVVIEDDVEIGANTCIDRAKFGSTLIGAGTKIDNLVQIAHNVRVGPHSIIVSQTGIAGSAQIGSYVVLGGQVGVRDHVRVGDRVMAAATTAIDHDIEPGQKIVGAPATPVREFFRQLALIKKLPELARDIKTLKKQVPNRASTEDHS